MTQREGGPGSPDEPADDAPTDDELDEAAGGLDQADLEADEDVTDELDADEGELGDANDEMPSSGATPGAVTPKTGRFRRPGGLGRGGAPDQPGTPGRPGGTARVGTAARPAPGPTPSEIAVRIDDRISAAFVVVTVGFFILLFVYAILFGGSGLLTPKPTPRPTPVPTASPTPIASESPSASVAASESAPASESAAPSAALPSASVAPSVAPSASPSGS